MMRLEHEQKPGVISVYFILSVALRFEIELISKGINTGTLAVKTGYKQKNIANIIYKMRKGCKVQSPEKGVYMKA